VCEGLVVHCRFFKRNGKGACCQEVLESNLVKKMKAGTCWGGETSFRPWWWKEGLVAY